MKMNTEMLKGCRTCHYEFCSICEIHKQYSYVFCNTYATSIKRIFEPCHESPCKSCQNYSNYLERK